MAARWSAGPPRTDFATAILRQCEGVAVDFAALFRASLMFADDCVCARKRRSDVQKRPSAWSRWVTEIACAATCLVSRHANGCNVIGAYH
jgi:hypothetical protein